MNSFAIVLTVLSATFINAFNISPQPNQEFGDPNIPTLMPKFQSSYFGYSLTLRKNSLMVGAPRAQSSLEIQRNINETGAIYKCSLDGNCHQYHFDRSGNTNDIGPEEYVISSIRQDYQWLGAVMDGHSSEDDRFVVCAPRFTAPYGDSEYLMHGSCFWTPNTNGDQPSEYYTIRSLKLRDNQQVSHTNSENDVTFTFYYMYGEQGFSVHISDNNEQILMGAPGIYNWKGSLVRHMPREQIDSGGHSRRDVTPISNVKKRQATQIQYQTNIPNPILWNQQDGSYFGYSVSSGYFDDADTNRLFYVASAPQANYQSGEVYIFDIFNVGKEFSINIKATLSGDQMGEFFGYSVLSEDFNGDRVSDVVVSAPLYSDLGTDESGVVYVYVNKGNFQFDRTILKPDVVSNGRFGTTIARIGDINLDGFNDLAIGAPYEGNGAVYIYFGTSNGISHQPSQVIHAPDGIMSPSFFGHGISRGTDIDRNMYNDIAIGAPNAERVFLYKTYPVAKIVAMVTPSSKELNPTDEWFNIKACWRLQSIPTVVVPTEISVNIKVDTLLDRAKFEDGSDEKNLTVKISETLICQEFPITVAFSLENIFRPIDIEMTSLLIKTVPDSKVFCEDCFAINPSDIKTIRNKVAFSTGCSGPVCKADLVLKSALVGVKLPYVIGSSTSITVEYKVKNLGEPAYLSQLKVTISPMASFVNTPSECEKEEHILVCDLNKRLPITTDEESVIRVSLDTTKFKGTSLLIEAETNSTGEETNPDDNIIKHDIPITEFSEVEIVGHSTHPNVVLADGLHTINATFEFELRNTGPSAINNMAVNINVPITYIDSANKRRIDLIDFNFLTIEAKYKKSVVTVEWSQNNTILIPNPEYSTSMPMVENMQGMGYDTSKIGFEYDMNTGNNGQEELNSVYRRKRHAYALQNEESNVDSNYNYFTQSVIPVHSVSRRSTDNRADSVIANLPANRTILFDCDTAEEGACVRGSFKLRDFHVGNDPIIITLNFGLDLKQVNKIVTDEQDIFVLLMSPTLMRADDEEMSSVNLVLKKAYIVVSKTLSSETPIWIWIVSAICGVLVLVIITTVLYKMGFFKREKKEEMEKLTRESVVPGADNLLPSGGETDNE